MNIAKSLEEFRSKPLAERPRWYISDSFFSAIPIQECGEPLVELGQLAQEMNLPIVLAPVAPEQGPKMYLRTTAAAFLMNALSLVQKKTEGKVMFKVTDTFRPLDLQRKYFEKIREDFRQKEKLEGKELYERTIQFIADPDLCPPHSTGGTIDLTLAWVKDGSELNMGTPVDAIEDLANTWHEAIVGEARTNRDLLADVMTEAGFVNLASEWWHFSYGDQYWAAFWNKPSAIYHTLKEAPRQ